MKVRDAKTKSKTEQEIWVMIKKYKNGYSMAAARKSPILLFYHTLPTVLYNIVTAIYAACRKT